jgi:hypothetical protein
MKHIIKPIWAVILTICVIIRALFEFLWELDLNNVNSFNIIEVSLRYGDIPV